MDMQTLYNKLKMTSSDIVAINDFSIVTRNKDDTHRVHLLNDDKLDVISHKNSEVRVNKHFVIVLPLVLPGVRAIYTKGSSKNLITSFGKVYTADTTKDVCLIKQSEFINDTHKLILACTASTIIIISYNGSVHQILNYQVFSYAAMDYNCFGEGIHGIKITNNLSDKHYYLGVTDELKFISVMQ